MTKSRALRRLNILILLALLFSACECPKKTQTLLFTTRLEGMIEPCGCTSDPLGGISRLAHVVRQTDKATFVNIGESFQDPNQPTDCPDPAKRDLIEAIFHQLGASKAQVLQEGVQILQTTFGIKIALVDLSREKLDTLQLPLDVDLIIWGQAPGDSVLPPFRLNANGPWVFSAGSWGQYLGRLEFYGLDQKKGPIALDTRAQDRQLQQLLLQKRLEVLKAKPADDFVRSRIRLAEQELKSLQNVQDKPLPGASMRFTAIPIKREMPEDSSVKALLKDYERKSPDRLSACENQIACPKPKLGEATYVGVETCKTCHAAAYEFWKKALVKVEGKNQTGETIQRLSGHSKAWKTLEDAGKTNDRNCIGCHSVGFMKPGGYCKAKEVKPFENVQCESCHGPGSLHVATGDKTKIQRQVPESQCRSCHHTPHIPSEASFVYQEKLKVILGPGHGESLLLKLSK